MYSHFKLIVNVFSDYHSDVEHQEAVEFMEKIFTKYGRGGVITYDGFEHLLANLGLGNINIVDHDIHDHYVNVCNLLC